MHGYAPPPTRQRSRGYPFVPRGRFATPPLQHSGRRAKSVRPPAFSAILVRRPLQVTEPCRQARTGTTTRSGHRDKWLTPRPRLRTLQMAEHCAPPTSRPDAARSAALRRDRLRVGAGRLRWRLLGPARPDCCTAPPRRKRLQPPPSSAAGSRTKPSGQLRQTSNATALTSAVIAANPNPQAIPTSSTPSRYTVPKAMVGAKCLSTTTTTVSTPINAAAATRPCQSGGGVGRTNSRMTRPPGRPGWPPVA